ncbi:MAG: hypothetical protein PUJ28_07265 [Prevotellaceae bacterium]|nr:hypothetical protein [Prevotellaceae bacterium]MEE1242099.1 hypothetical protein [Bacteroidaceae bacterium]
MNKKIYITPEMHTVELAQELPIANSIFVCNSLGDEEEYVKGEGIPCEPATGDRKLWDDAW